MIVIIIINIIIIVIIIIIIISSSSSIMMMMMMMSIHYVLYTFGVDISVNSFDLFRVLDLEVVTHYLRSRYFYVQRDVVAEHFESGRPTDEQGVEDAFELLHEISDRIRTGLWVGDCFIYNTSAWRLNYCVGGEVSSGSALLINGDRSMACIMILLFP